MAITKPVIMKAFLFALTLLMSGLFTSAQAQTMTITLDHHKTTYIGEGRHDAFRVLRDNGKWGSMDEGIEGFTYEWGKVYTLKVRKSTIKNPPMDGSSARYKLIKVISIEEPAEKTFTMNVKGEHKYYGFVSMITEKDGEHFLLYDVKIQKGPLLDELLEKLNEDGTKVTFQHEEGPVVSVVSVE